MTRAPRILLAEDDDDLRGLMARALRGDGCQVIEARDGLELLDLLRKALAPASLGTPIDLVVTDVRMPGCSGLEILQGMRRAEWTVPVLVFTAFGSAETHDAARRLGAVDVLDKPLDLEEFRIAVWRVVGQAAARAKRIS